MALIETRGLCQAYGERKILNNINLRVDRGEVFALIGPTGTGKTTLLRLIDLIDTPASGKILFDGEDVVLSGARLAARRRMAFVLQKPVVFNISVYDNIASGLKWRGLNKSSIRERVSDILEVVGLSAYKDRNARTLSGGEVQRVAIARAIAIKPEVLLLDEPTANLDPLSASRVEELITDVIKRHVTTVIMSTHDMMQGQRIADRIGVLMNGEILQTGTPGEIFTSPKSRELAEFVGMENIIDGVVKSSDDNVVTIDVKGRIIEAVAEYAVGDDVSAGIRPEEVTLALSRISSSARNSFGGEVTRVISTGPFSRVEVDCGFPLVALITRKSAGELDLKRGKQVYATFKATGVHVIRRVKGSVLVKDGKTEQSGL